MLIIKNARQSVAIPLQSMAHAKSIEGGWSIIDCNGDEHKVSNIDWDLTVEGTPVSSFAALPGTYLINPADDSEKERKYWRENVLGWMICADTALRPVVMGPEALLSPPWQVLHPDGRVERSDGSTWETVDEWLADIARVSSPST